MGKPLLEQWFRYIRVGTGFLGLSDEYACGDLLDCTAGSACCIGDRGRA